MDNDVEHVSPGFFMRHNQLFKKIKSEMQKNNEQADYFDKVSVHYEQECKIWRYGFFALLIVFIIMTVCVYHVWLGNALVVLAGCLFLLLMILLLFFFCRHVLCPPRPLTAPY